MLTSDRHRITRERILDAADRLFRHLSYPGLRMKNLSDHLGLSRKTLYNHFPDGKRAIWRSCVERRMREFADRLVSIVEDTGGDYVRRGGRILDIGREAIGVFYGPDGLISSADDEMVFFPEIRSRYVRALSRFFREGVDRGLLRPDLPVRTLSEVMVVLIAAWGGRDSTLSEGELKSLPEFVEQVMFTGILTENGRRESRQIVGGADRG